MDSATSLTPERVQALVARYLEEEFAEEERPYILDESISVEGDWWMVPVVMRTEPKARFDYYGRLADVEGVIYKKEGLDIELIPASPRAA